MESSDISCNLFYKVIILQPIITKKMLIHFKYINVLMWMTSSDKKELGIKEEFPLLTYCVSALRIVCVWLPQNG